MEMQNTDMIVHDKYVWHYSGPNLEENYTRSDFRYVFLQKKLAIFLDQGRFFTQQIKIEHGEIVQGKPFPLMK